MAGWNTSSDYAKISVILLSISGVVFIIAYGAPYWTTRDDGHAGLWSGCTDGVCYERYNQWVVTWIKVTQTCMTLSLIFWFFGLLLLLLYIFHRECQDDKRLIFLSAILIGLTAFCELIGVLVWAADEHMGSGEELNWPFAFACATVLTFALACYILVKELRRHKK